MANVRERMDSEYQELHAINEKQEGLLAAVERKPKLTGEVPELREKLCQEIKKLDGRISTEMVELLQKK